MKYVIYIIILVSLLVISKIKPSYIFDIITYMLLTLLYIVTGAMILVIATTVITIIFQNIISIIKKKEFKPAIGAIVSIVSICVLIIKNFVTI